MNHNLIAAFLEMMAAEPAASIRTLDAYRRDLEDYVACLTSLISNLIAAQDGHLQKYVASLLDADLAPHTPARHLSADRQFHKFPYAAIYRSDASCITALTPASGQPIAHVADYHENPSPDYDCRQT